MSGEEQRWRPAQFEGIVGRSALRRQTGSYRSAVPASIAAVTPVLAAGTSALADDASSEIARFDAEMGADIAPFAAVLLRSESASSSQIEHLTASPRAIALAEIGDTRRRNATEIVANTRAMTAAVDLADQLDAEAVLTMHRALMGTTHPTLAGQWRQEQVWIGRSELGPIGADFVPPHHDRIPAAIDDLVAFMARDDLPVLVHAAAAHAQFETIHPFADGNGRTGRALVHAMLRGRGLTRSVTVPVSAGLLADTGSYFEALTRYRDGELDPIVVLMARASFGAIRNGRRLVADLRAVRQRWTDAVTARRDSAVWRVLDLLLRQPVVDSETLHRELGLPAGNAGRYLQPLEDAGVLIEFSGQRRNRLWRADDALRAVEAFAARSVRRSLPG